MVCEGPELLSDPALIVSALGHRSPSAPVLEGSEMPDESPWTELAAGLEGAMNLGARGEDGPWIACAQLAPALEAWIPGCDATVPAARSRGAQTALILARLRHVPPGALAVA